MIYFCANRNRATVTAACTMASAQSLDPLPSSNEREPVSVSPLDATTTSGNESPQPKAENRRSPHSPDDSPSPRAHRSPAYSPLEPTPYYVRPQMTMNGSNMSMPPQDIPQVSHLHSDVFPDGQHATTQRLFAHTTAEMQQMWSHVGQATRSAWPQADARMFHAARLRRKVPDYGFVEVCFARRSVRSGGSVKFLQCMHR
jgi:hypothetical protein